MGCGDAFQHAPHHNVGLYAEHELYSRRGPSAFRLVLGSADDNVAGLHGHSESWFRSRYKSSAGLRMLADACHLSTGGRGSAYRLAAKLAEHKRAFRNYSRTDSLTGLLNQGAWRVALEEEYALGKREVGMATLALIDIDHFKLVNDGYGHQTGDEVIKMFGVLLDEVTRSTDIAGRIGGDEFGLILRGSDKAQAGNLLARLQQRLAEAFTSQAELPVVSLSIGVATFSLEYGNVEAWLRSCDRALYEAKAQGRNRIVVSAG